MIIGIHAIAAFKKERTGIEEYTYQLIKHIAMLPEARGHRFILYTNRIFNFSAHGESRPMAGQFSIPDNFEIRVLQWPIIWTQIRLSLEMLKKECDVLFIPAHVLPIIHPKNSVVTIHGLEYEYFPRYYPFWFRKYLRQATKYSVKHARKIIAVSKNTKKDLVEWYGIKPEKIEVVYHGVEISNLKSQISKLQFKIQNYILYLGRIELKKNIEGIIKAFEIFKEKYRLPYKLVLVGPSGFGYDEIKLKIQSRLFSQKGRDKNDIIETGFIDEKEKEELYHNASLLLFPSFYEGFGMPILEAQARGVPVITSNISSMPEAGGDGALYVDPNDYNNIANKVYQLLTNNALRRDIINRGYNNVKKFSWEKCARETLNILLF